MCGIVGFIERSSNRDCSLSHLTNMLTTIYHRGPDDGGKFVDENYGIALGHRRLSILDLSQTGHQPMQSSCGRFVIVFNGEIYNHLELRKTLENENQLLVGWWRGHTDTETLLACFSAWGIEKTLQSTVGMFALAMWDNQEKILILARDRIGEKPLYYGWQNEAFLFGSELKSLCMHPSFNGEIDWHVASTFLHLNYIPTPSSIYQGIFKLEPGTFLQLLPNNIEKYTLPTPITYWSLEDTVKQAIERPYIGNFFDAVHELETLVRQAVQLQSVADVSVGAFLSGGIDSSTVVAMMQSATTSKVTTFSIGMPDAKMDESHHAARVAKHLGTNHIEHLIQPKEALDLIPQLTKIWDEPFADSSQLPTFLVSKLAKQHVTVALSGDGGDEFFLGYPQYALFQKLWKTRCFGNLPWDAFFCAFSSKANNDQFRTFFRRTKSIVNGWRQPDTQALNRFWMDKYRQGNVPLKEQRGIEMLSFPILADPATTSGLWDSGTYLPDDILVKVDRAAMANSLETRAPLLDHRIIEFAFRLPLEFKMQHGIGKKVLREVLYKYVPKKIVNRPKMGFSIPLASWMRNELRPWVEYNIDFINKDKGPWDKKMVNQLWLEHMNGQRDRTEQLWAIIMLGNFVLKSPMGDQ